MQQYRCINLLVGFCMYFSLSCASEDPGKKIDTCTVTSFVEQVYQNVIAQGIVDARNAQAAYEHGAHFDQRDVVQVYTLFSRRPLTQLMQHYPFLNDQANVLRDLIAPALNCQTQEVAVHKQDPNFWASFYRNARAELAKHMPNVRFMSTDYETMLENNTCSVSKLQERESLLKKYPDFAAALIITARLMAFHNQSDQVTFVQIFVDFVPKQHKLPKDDEQLGGMCSIV